MTNQELMDRYDRTRTALLTDSTREAMLEHAETLRMIQERFPGIKYAHSTGETALGRDPQNG